MGLTDYSRFVRKHRNYFGLTETGEIESGVSHVDARLSPFAPPPADQVPALNSHQLGQVEAREDVYTRWGVGQPYQNLATQTVRVHFGRSPGLTLGALRSAAAGVTGIARSVGAAVSPLIAAPLYASAIAALPFVLAGGLKIVYDLLLWRAFRSTPAPEDPKGWLRSRSKTGPTPRPFGPR